MTASGAGRARFAGLCGAAWLVGAGVRASCVGLELLASTAYDGPQNANDWAQGAALDGSRNVVVVGFEWGSFGQNNWRIRKYDATLGTLLASTDYNGAGNADDQAFAVAVDPNGNIVVAGHETGSSGGLNWRVNKYNASLTALLGSTSYDDAAGSSDHAFAVATDAAGNVVVAGQTGWSSFGVANTWLVRKYDVSLTTLVGSTEYTGPVTAPAAAQAVAVDPSGTIVVAGWETGAKSDYNWRIRKYDAALGTLLATTDYDSPAGSSDFALAVALDGSGNVVAGGDEYGTAFHGRIRKYSPGLTTLLATTAYDDPASSTDEVHALGFDGSGNIVTAGDENVGGNYGWVVRKYDASLSTLLAGTDFQGADNADDRLYGMGADGDGNVVVAGFEHTLTVGDNWRVLRYCLPPPVAPAPGGATRFAAEDALQAFPNPATGDAATLALGLRQDAVEVTVDVFNTAMQRVLHRVWPNVARTPGTVALTGLKAWAPGVYLVRATARFADGSTRRFPVRKLAVKR